MDCRDRWASVLLGVAVGMSASCSPATSRSPLAHDAGGVLDRDAFVPGCDSTDADGDGIADLLEGSCPFPSGTPVDCDGDGYSNAEEARSRNPCAVFHSDGDGVADFMDTDSDNDGLSDAEERELGTDPTSIDTDRDGVTDLGEVGGTNTDPLDPTSTIDPDDFFVVLPHGDPAQVRTLEFGTAITRADVVFLIDTSSSTRAVRRQLIETITTEIVPGIRALTADVEFGVAGFGDYPAGPHGAMGDESLAVLASVQAPETDRGRWPIATTTTMCPTGTFADVVAPPNGESDLIEALRGLPCMSGGDDPEAQVAALYGVLTGEAPAWSRPRATECGAGAWGAVCFRPGALPIVVLSTDTVFHNGPGNEEPYTDITSWDYDTLVREVVRTHTRVVGLWGNWTFSPKRRHIEQLVRDSGAVRRDGTPILYTIGSGLGFEDAVGVGEGVVAAVRDLVTDVPQDVTTRTEDVPPNPGAIDARTFLRSVVPRDGRNGATRGPSPGVTYDHADATTFYAVIPGTALEFDVTFENTDVPPGADAQIYRAAITVIGQGVTILDRRQVFIIVPPAGEIILI